MAKHYVVGFLFDTERENVLLIRKARPAWQAGLLNGVGGKVEHLESAREAMVREFFEEAGVRTDGSFWEHLVSLQRGDVFNITFFRACSSNVLALVHTQTDESLVLTRVSTIGAPDVRVVPNVRWLVPFAVRPGVVLPVVLTDDGQIPSALDFAREIERAGVI